ncbi:71b3be25-ee30-45ea-adef-af27a502ed57 [Thermothielavioides terrestris]|uniref:71b3be25-ee30-45ea-adef-af27a502ed57 n=1 Tax=Thermothielavioides terrestris TaxID=2587410 RepID=A0A3S4AVM1_9PEZI|nr:71b3be25-ee30-45ea-adef-af27a502ed57 [Thermothielavioides terrestris]
MSSSSESYDIVIVGGGTAGLVLAARLSEDASMKVVVVEAGPDQLANPQVLTPGMWPLLSHSKLDWAFTTVPQGNLASPAAVDLPQGRLLGGSSGINSFLFTPTSKDNVNAWAKLGNDGWDYDIFQAALKRSYTFHTPSGVRQGDGPLQLAVHVSEPQVTWAKAWAESLESLGFPSCDPFSGTVCGSFDNPESVYPETKQRCFSANAYLGSARDRANLTVLTDTTATKILLKRSSEHGEAVVAEGIQIKTKDGEVRTITARREVILSAGAINSPRLLEISGIGDSALLNRLGIDVAIDNPHVGENLQNHVYTGVVLEIRDDVETLDPFLRSEPQAVNAATQAYAQGTGPLASSSIVASAQLPLPKAGQGDDDDIAQLVQQHLSTDSARDAAQKTTAEAAAFTAANEAYVRRVLTSATEASATYLIFPAYMSFEDLDPRFRAPGNHITIGVMLSHPLSRGSVHITTASADALAGSSGVAIDPRYLTHPLDIEVLARHVRFTERAIAAAPPIARYLKHGAPGSRFAELGAAREYVRSTARGAHHYTGTCAMQPRELGGVVDARLRVHGCANLRVCDASVVPLEPTANTQAVVYGVAEMGAQIVREDLTRA